MSDAAIANIITGLVTIATLVIGWLTLWTKLRYGIERSDEAAARATTAARKAEVVVPALTSISERLDENTLITSQTKDAAKKAAEHSVNCDEERAAMLSEMKNHHDRITKLEAQMTTLQLSVEGLGKDITSTRHEMRGHLQTIANKLDLISIAGRSTPVPPSGT